MGHARRLWDFLKPMGPYQDRGRYIGGELDSEGAALDAVQGQLALLEREVFPDTAESFGLERIEELLSSRPVTRTVEGRRKALIALLRIGGDSFTLKAINDNLAGCGVNAAVRETADPGVVEVSFPDVPGIPRDMEALRRIIEEIIPCHLEIHYVYWYITWGKMEQKFRKWMQIEAGGYTWDSLERQVR